jgi:hypothetical protein
MNHAGIRYRNPIQLWGFLAGLLPGVILEIVAPSAPLYFTRFQQNIWQGSLGEAGTRVREEPCQTIPVQTCTSNVHVM